MELLLFLFIVATIVLVLKALSNAKEARRQLDELQSRVRTLETEVLLSRRDPDPAPVADPGIIVPARVSRLPIPRQSSPPALPKTIHRAEPVSPLAPEPAPPQATSRPAPEPEPPAPHVGWEEFMGAKLFAWIGGLALFLGIAFFVKYSFEHFYVPPEARVTVGFIAGLALLAGGDLVKRKEHVVTAQTLCATGILVLYAVTYACRSYYHFAFFGLLPTFVIMSLITGVAFMLSVRMNALAVAVLGVAGGFLTPGLLYNGEDYPLALFGYIALLDIGLLAIARRQHWNALPVLGAIGTVITEFSWMGAFFVPRYYFSGNRIFVAMAVMAGFQGLFLAAVRRAKGNAETDYSPAGPALLLGAAAFLTAFFFMSFSELGHRPVLLCGYLFLVDLGLVGLTLITNRFTAVRGVAGLAAFIFIGAWMEFYLTNDYLAAALGCAFVFALFHSILPLMLQRLGKTAAPAWCHIFPVCALALVMVPIFQFNNLSMLIWPFVLLVDLLAFVVAITTMTLAPVLVVLALTLVAIGGALSDIPPDLTGLPVDLFLLGGFAIFFLAAGAWAARRLAPKGGGPAKLFGPMGDPANLAVQIPALSAILPFLLLIMVFLRLPLHDPSPVFGLALLLVLLLLGIGSLLSIEALPMVGLVAVLALEHAWLASPFHSERLLVSLDWQLAFYGVFTCYPFLYRKQLAETRAPWAASALAGPFHFYLMHEVVRVAFPAMQPGLLPALLAVPPLAGLALLARQQSAANPARNTQLALYGGAGLFFITLIFPLQYHREWITISWALEGAALCWLFRRVPHPGLRLTGVVLLAVAFARLGLNPLVLSYHARAAHPFFNWYLYAYGVVSVALFAGAVQLAKPRNLALGVNVEALLHTLGTVLAFLLVNIEIADYFNTPGAPVLTFEFSGNFARDMSYSIAWALFALLLLVIGIARRNAPVRYAGVALLSVTILKLFIHDLSELDQLYRIGAFIAVAVIAIAASYLYQRFFALPPHKGEPDAPR